MPIALVLGWMVILRRLYCTCLLLAVVSALLVPFPLITSLVLAILPMIMTWMIPLELAHDRGSFRKLLYVFVGTILFSIVVYASVYYRSGLCVSGESYDATFLDALYFSITTWTTLGYGDFAPAPECRLVTSVEALTGYFSMGIFIVLVGLWITEALRAAEQWLAPGGLPTKDSEEGAC